MLPNWPLLKDEFSKAFARHIRARVRERSATGILPSTTQHEGERSSITRADGTREEVDFLTAEGIVEIKVEELESLRLRDMLPKLDPVVESLAKSMSEHLFSTMDRITKQTGNVLDGKGQPISAEHMLEVLDRMDLNFGRDGLPKWPTLLISSSQGERAKNEFRRFSREPSLRASFEQLVQQKREEWRVREADRILVG